MAGSILAEASAAVPAVGVLIAAGLGLQALLPAPLERPLAARLGFAFLLGTAWTGMGTWVAGYLLGIDLGRQLVGAVAGAAVLAGLVAITVRRGGAGGLARRSPPRGRRRLRFAPLLTSAAIALPTGALLLHAATEPVSDFDGRMTWGTTAKYLQADRSVLPETLRERYVYIIHPRYPILLPLLQVAVAELGDAPLASGAIRPLYVLFLPALAAIVWPAARRCGRGGGAALAMLLVLTAPMFLWQKEGGANGTYSDLPLAAFLGAALVLLTHPRAIAQPWRGAVAGLALAATAGSKNEGMALAAAVAVSAIAVAMTRGRRLWRRRAAAPIVAGLVTVAAIALVVAWRTEIPNRNDEAYFEKLSIPAVFAGAVDRAPLIARQVVDRTFAIETWGLLFWVAPFLLLAGWRALRGPVATLAGVVLAVGLAQFVAAYSVAPNPWLIGVTWDRLLIQMSVPILLFFAAASGRALAVARRPCLDPAQAFEDGS